MSDKSAYHAEIGSLRDNLEKVTEENCRLKELLKPLNIGRYPPHWKLTRSHQKMLEALRLAPDGLSREALHYALYGSESEVELNVVGVFICHIRRCLPKNIEIKNIHGEGYWIPPEGRTALDKAVAITRDYLAKV